MNFRQNNTNYIMIGMHFILMVAPLDFVGQSVQRFTQRIESSVCSRNYPREELSQLVLKYILLTAGLLSSLPVGRPCIACHFPNMKPLVPVPPRTAENYQVPDINGVVCERLQKGKSNNQGIAVVFPPYKTHLVYFE